ncbi:recombination regulator RecX [Companilactobacillus halodurans]|uniref:Regulatory protein RecX n=1 Tax=Companilactobacillus halodurans TaxID=2584183 RepID=A0A5P0ZQS4_9LACO|nr:recombination regulator RecX [Companilactobacillus halodurans]MQS76597.1 recombination regulator RecX [Companilactobacillus halodurans]MQS98198.1 recombination regulator RecX [Companilactobacillus halodurans]
MAKITKIQAQKRKGRYNIYLDGKYSFPVAENTLIEFRLMNGVELTDGQIKEIQSRENVNKAYGDAVNYLSYQLRTEKEIKEYLYKKEYHRDAVDLTIDRLKDLHYIDDENYAQSFINTQLRMSANGPKIIEQKMLQKGVPSAVIQNKLDEIDQDILVENAIEFAKKQVRKQKRASFKQMLNKLRQSLYQKGFNKEIIDETINHLDLEPDEDEELDKLRALVKKVEHRYDKPEKLIHYLMTKGYHFDDIKKVLEEEIE